MRKKKTPGDNMESRRKAGAIRKNGRKEGWRRKGKRERVKEEAV